MTGAQRLVPGAPRVVVGAAIVEHCRLLATRRTSPAAHAGRWELPGGKVDSGEPARAALVREVGEELGCTVRVGARIPGAQPLRPGLVLHAYECVLVDGDPVPHEHDALRWLAPEELDEVAWLPADLPFVDALRARLLAGEPLPGGNVGGAVRIGGTVRRPTGPWTPAVHGLLRHLEHTALDGVPRVLGVDVCGREVLTLLPGAPVADEMDEPADDVLAAAAEWLRRFHDQVAAYRPVGAVRWRQTSRALDPDEIVCHHDPGAYNWLVHDGRFAGVVDWDMAGPGRPLDDLGFLAWTGVPLFREMPTEQVVRRLRLLSHAYRGVEPGVVLHASAARMETACRRIAAGQAAGDEGMLSLRRLGEPARTRTRVAAMRRRLPTIAAALRRS